jgi:pimeloyl-ACP methyl ester carboxylesterase
MEQVLAKRPPIDVPAMILNGGDDSFGRQPAEISPAERQVFPKLVGKRIVDGAGHFVPHEKPLDVANAILDLMQAAK